MDLECDEDQSSVWAIQERHAGGGWERSLIGKGTLSVVSQNVVALVSQRRADFEIICIGESWIQFGSCKRTV